MKWTQYIYRDNKKNATIMFKCFADSIASADAKFEHKFGVHPVKLAYVGCEVKVYSEQFLFDLGSLN